MQGESDIEQPRESASTGGGGTRDYGTRVNRGHVVRAGRQVFTNQERENGTPARAKRALIRILLSFFTPRTAAISSHGLLRRSLIMPRIFSASAAFGSNFRYFSISSAASLFLCAL